MEIALIALITSVAVAGCYAAANAPRPVPVRVRSNRRNQRR
ncbi:hypothetical protein [Skermanella rosea]|nr:hypothetical protein [Skermanella rosea]